MLRANGRLRSGGNGFSPGNLFVGGGAGLWLDPSDLTTGYQDSTGATPQTTAGQPTGMRLDKRLGATRGSEEVVSPYSGVASGGFAITSTSITRDGVTAAGSAAIDLGSTLTAGRYYEVTFTVASLSGDTFTCSIDGQATNAGQISSNGAKRAILKAAAQPTILFYPWGGGAGAATITSISVKSVEGNHVTQASTAARPTWDLVGGAYSDYFDGTDDGYATATISAGTLTNDMDCFVAIKRASAADGLLGFVTAGAVGYFGAWDAGAALSSDASVGTPTYKVNGSAVTGTRDALNTAITNGSWVVVEVLNLDLSAFTAYRFGDYGLGFNVNADIGGIVLCPVQNEASRAKVRRWLGNKVGLSL